MVVVVLVVVENAEEDRVRRCGSCGRPGADAVVGAAVGSGDEECRAAVLIACRRM